MRILAVSDTKAKRFYDCYTPGCLSSYDLIIACGDLPTGYLDFLVTMSGVPLLYVRGNHDEKLLKEPPAGCECIEDRVFTYKGVRFLGLGGSMRYKNSPCMYTEREMRMRIRRVIPELWRHQGFDVLVTHAPARGLNDLEDIPHRGFECFNALIEKYRPKCFIHGHVHMNYGHSIPRFTKRESTLIVNACGYAEIEIEEPEAKPKKRPFSKLSFRKNKA